MYEQSASEFHAVGFHDWIAAHEFIHAIGLEHPTHGHPGVRANADGEYNTPDSGLDIHRREVNGKDLMGCATDIGNGKSGLKEVLF